MPALSRKVKACRALHLTDRFEPTVRISHLVQIKLPETIACLRTSASEDAQTICALFDRLTEDARAAIDIDYLIAAAQCKDVYRVLGLIVETYAKTKAAETQIIASTESPVVMRNVARYAKERKGFQHARLLLQTTGVAPVSKNQTNYIIGNKVQNNQVNNPVINNIPSHSEIASAVDEVVRELQPREDVPSHYHSGEEEGDREEDQEDAD